MGGRSGEGGGERDADGESDERRGEADDEVVADAQ